MEMEDTAGIILVPTFVASLWHERDLEIHLLRPTLKKKKQPICLLTCLQFMISCHQSWTKAHR